MLACRGQGSGWHEPGPVASCSESPLRGTSRGPDPRMAPCPSAESRYQACRSLRWNRKEDEVRHGPTAKGGDHQPFARRQRHSAGPSARRCPDSAQSRKSAHEQRSSEERPPGESREPRASRQPLGIAAAVQAERRTPRPRTAHLPPVIAHRVTLSLPTPFQNEAIASTI